LDKPPNRSKIISQMKFFLFLEFFISPFSFPLSNCSNLLEINPIFK